MLYRRATSWWRPLLAGPLLSIALMMGLLLVYQGSRQNYNLGRYSILILSDIVFCREIQTSANVQEFLWILSIFRFNALLFCYEIHESRWNA